MGHVRQCRLPNTGHFVHSVPPHHQECPIRPRLGSRPACRRRTLHGIVQRSSGGIARGASRTARPFLLRAPVAKWVRCPSARPSRYPYRDLLAVRYRVRHPSEALSVNLCSWCGRSKACRPISWNSPKDGRTLSGWVCLHCETGEKDDGCRTCLRRRERGLLPKVERMCFRCPYKTKRLPSWSSQSANSSLRKNGITRSALAAWKAIGMRSRSTTAQTITTRADPSSADQET